MALRHANDWALDRAFTRLCRRDLPGVYQYALAVLHDPDAAQEVTEATFRNGRYAIDRGEPVDLSRNWLIGIAHELCRQRTRHAGGFELDETGTDADEPRHGDADVHRALGRLPSDQCTALVMRELEGRSYREVAGLMGLSGGQVEELVFRGRRALREALEGSLRCADAELALSRHVDGMLRRSEREQLLAHVRGCAACATLAHRLRVTRGALRVLASTPFPTSLLSFLGDDPCVGVGGDIAPLA
jgi:RNA polymerase sigma-70 factor (ECF subfamily)